MSRRKKSGRKHHPYQYSSWRGVAFDWIVEADEALEVVADSKKFENLKFRIEIQEDSTDGNLIEVNETGRIKPIESEFDKHEYISISIKIAGRDGSIINQSRYERVLKLVKER